METLFEDPSLDENQGAIYNNDNNLLLNGIEDYKNDTASLMSSMNDVPIENEFSFEKLFDVQPIANTDTAEQQQNEQASQNHLGFELQQQQFGDELSLVNSNNTLVSNTYNNQQNVFPNQFPYNDVNGVNRNNPNLSDYYNNDKKLSNFAWDFNFDTASFNNLHGDSTTLGSSSRASHECFESLNSIDDIDAINDQTRRSRFTSSISNSISSIFKSSSNSNSSSNNRFNLRVINPLSTHRDPKVLVKSLPNLVENVENLSIDQEEDAAITGVTNEETNYSKKKKCMKNSHLKNCNCNKRGKKTRSSLVSTLTNGRIGGDRNQQVQASQAQETIPEIEIQDALEDIAMDNAEQIQFKFDDELTRVISLASLNSSNYNFNHNDQSSRSSQNMLESPPVSEQTEAKNETENHSPDYAALFSDVNVSSKKRSKSISFKKMASLNTTSSSLPPLPEDLDLITPISSQPSQFSEQATPLQDGCLSTPKHSGPQFNLDQNQQPVPPPDYQPPIHEPTRRGRKPSLAYDASKQFVCTYCSRRFRRQEHLKRHFRSLHTNEKPFDCELCGKKFSRSDNLAQHIKTHGNENI